MGRLVKVAEFDNANEAHVLRSRLEAEGIPCYLANENLNNLIPGVGFTRIVLQVPLEASIRAMDIIYENPLDPPTRL